MKFFCATFMCLQYELVIFWQKDFGAKAAHKMLAKLTPGVNSPIFYEQFFHAKVFAQLLCAYNLGL